MTMAADVERALATLRAAADPLRRGWFPTTWERTAGGPAAGPVTMAQGSFIDQPCGYFVDLGLAGDGVPVTVRAPLALPERLHGIELAGQPLELTLNTIFPATAHVDGRPIFEDSLPVVATGPALVTLIQNLDPALPPPVLELTVTPPKTQTNPGWLFLHFTTPALREQFGVFDAAWARLRLAASLAVGDEEHKAVHAAVELIPATVTELDPQRARTLGAAVQDALAPVAHRAEALRVHAAGHTHIDLAWLWTWDDAREVVKRDVRSVLGLMDEFPAMRFTHSQAATYQVLEREAPDLFARVCDRIAEGRWEAATLQWVEGDENLSSGESACRQLLEGVQYSRQALGVSPTVFFAPDTFGHAGNIPQLAVSAGARVYYHHRGNPGQRWGGDMWPAYWWEGDDGTRLLSCSTAIYSAVEVTAGSLAEVVLELAHGAGLPTALHLYGVGDHGGGPTRHALQLLSSLRDAPGLPRVLMSTVQAYADDVLASGVPLPVHRGESENMFEGCYTTHSDTKRYNRSGEAMLATAETLASATGLDHRDELATAWRSVLFNQFHDILAGSAIREAYADHAAQFQAVHRVASGIIDDALGARQAGMEPGSIAVTNPLAIDRTDVVVVGGVGGEGAVSVAGPDGRAIPAQRTEDGLVFVASVPALGTISYRLLEDSASEDLEVEARDVRAGDPAGFWCVNTPFYRAEVRRDCGVITSLVDRRSGRQLVRWGQRRTSDYMDAARPDLAIGVVQLVEEHPHVMSAWQFAEVFRETSLIRGATTEVVDQGPVRVILETHHTVRASSVRQRLVFYRDLPRIDVSLLIDWQEKGSGSEGFPNLVYSVTPRLDQPQAWFETPYSAVRRAVDGQEVAALRWADVGDAISGIALLNDSKHGHSALGPRLRLSLVRTAVDPDAISDAGPQEVRLALLPHAGRWQEAGVPAAAAGFNQPLLGRLVAASTGAKHIVHLPVVTGADSVHISMVKRPCSGEGGLVLRLVETAGRHAHATISVAGAGSRVVELSVVEDVLGELPVNSVAVRVSMRPFQVRTLLFR